ncbi:hypothetical protein [Myroides phaeus]|uniref:Uncharacterized protein n=1 Tax=Myroides phaeus TaxID=702745 RepID=A0A1G8CUQ1_9FLAO|nr:hypothetical protein [Myroides phaeus]SDH49257.1 hypothetical protein SAMN05421818_10523 [Myroides phaeus]
MAKLDNKGKLHGLVGTVIAREMGGKQIIQSKGKKRKMNKQSLENFNEFKIASSNGKIIRSNIEKALDHKHDKYLYRRFTGALYNALKSNKELDKGQRNLLNSSMESLKGFEFNETHPFDKAFYAKIKTELSEDNKLHITVSSFEPSKFVIFPDIATVACLKFSLYTDELKGEKQTLLPNHIFEFASSKTTTEEFHCYFDLPKQVNFTIIIAELLFYYTTEGDNKKLYNNKLYHPSTIIFGK